MRLRERYSNVLRRTLAEKLESAWRINMSDRTQTKLTPVSYSGIGANDYFGFGVISFFEDVQSVTDDSFLGNDAERERFDVARRSAAEAFSEISARSKDRLSAEESEIFEIYKDLCMDDDLYDEVILRISEKKNAEAALSEAAEAIALKFEAIDDEYICARAADIRNTAKEIRRHLPGFSKRKEKAQKSVPSGTSSDRKIIVADDLSPADTMRIDTAKTAGFVLYSGSKSSHTSILARSLGIPCIIGAENIDPSLDGAFAVIDAKEGLITINPDVEMMREYANRASLESENGRRLETIRYAEPLSKSGRRMHVYANVGSITDIENSYIDAVSGCGLFRSEFLFLESRHMPSENEQFAVYKSLLSRFGHRTAVIRVLDIGADKVPPYIKSLKREENPALGVRGIRFLLREKDIFRTQLRAIIRASAFGNPAIMLPMVTSVSEILETRELISQIKNELRYEEVEFAEKIPLGIMIETPASAVMSDVLAKHCDFFSVGTNDLCQYTLAADRQNPDVGRIIDDNLEPVMRLVAKASEEIHKCGGWIGICGEIASDTKLTERFLDLKIDEISVSLPYVLRAKQAIINAK